MYRKRNGQSGFSLVEVLVAMVILAIGLIALMRLFPISVRQSEAANQRTTVAFLAKTELGRARTAGVANLLDDWKVKNAFYPLDALRESHMVYTGWRSSVQRVAGDVDLFRVTFAVDLLDGRQEKFVTYVTRQ